MSYSHTATETKTFTLTHAKHMAAKVAADLKRLQRLYGHVTDANIAQYEAEAIELMRQGYLECVTYGFKRDGNWIEPTLRYTAQDLASGDVDDDPGRVTPNRNIEGAIFYSFLTYSPAWYGLTSAAQDAVNSQLPVKRGTATEPQVSGYFVNDKTYSSGGRALGRSSVRSYT